MSVAMQVTKRRITSIKATSKITKAMKLVAITKLKVWQRRYEENKHFSDDFIELMQNTVNTDEEITSPYFEEQVEAEGDLHVIITSSLGLCGSFNNAIYSKVESLLQPTDTLIIVGRRGHRHFQDTSYAKIENFIDLGIDFDETRFLASFIRHAYAEKKYRRVFVHYTEYLNSLASRVNSEQLLPLKRKKDANLTSENLHPGAIVEPTREEFFISLLPIYINSRLYSFLLASQVSEQSARRNAMEQATKNADDLIDRLMIEYNTARQAAITQEITEVIAGGK